MQTNHKINHKNRKRVTFMSEQKEQTKNQVWQMIKFTLFSISAGIIQFGSCAILLEAFKMIYWPAYLISLVLSVLWNFTFNRRYTFRSDANIPKAMLLVFLYYLVFTPLSTWWGNYFTNIGWNDFLVLGGTMVINFVTEFLYQRFVVYRNSIDNNDVANRTKQKDA
ncbi:MAG: GtrA family protein [Clostridia bacterium]